MTIEENLERLEKILNEIENSSTGLERSVEKYEEAGKIIKDCYESIKKCDGKIIEITEDLNQINFDENK